MKTKIVIGMVACAALGCTLASPASAYIGPGVGAGAVAAVFGVIGSIFLAIIGVVYYPIKRMLKGRKRPTGAPTNQTDDTI